jgi:hypothetical protein
MNSLNINGEAFLRRWVLFVLSLTILVTAACGKKARTANNDDLKPAAVAAANFDGGTYCVQTITQGPAPAQPLHFSNKENESDGSAKDFESDLSGDKFEVTLRQRHKATQYDKSGSTPAVDNGPIHSPSITTTVADGFAEVVQTNHYARSEPNQWSMGISTVAQGGTPWDLFINKPTTTKVGSETINGFETDKYAIDTTRQTQLEKSALLMAGQLRDYNIVGTAWVAKPEACIVQYQIDYEEDAKDGSVRKVHYEGGVTKQ